MPAALFRLKIRVQAEAEVVKTFEAIVAEVVKIFEATLKSSWNKALAANPISLNDGSYDVEDLATPVYDERWKWDADCWARQQARD